MKTVLRSIPRFLVLGTLLASVTVARATVINPVTLDDLADQAELIFEGVVTNIDYRMSEQDSPDQPRLPFTFVTFYMERTLKGSSLGGDAVTLRFEGGPTDDGKFLVIPGMPLFDLGDRDILFVRGNGMAITPIVGWSQGRYRVIRGELFSDEGQELRATPEGGLARGRRHDLEEVSTNRIGEVLFETVSGGENAPEHNERIAPPDRGPESPRLSVDEFENLVVAKVRAGKGRGATPVPSADVRTRIVAPAARPVPPPAEAEPVR